MVSTLKTKDGYIAAYIEWHILDENGKMKNDGEYIYVRNAWIHKDYKGGKVLAELSDLIYKHPYSQASTKVYWEVYKDEKGQKILEEEERKWFSHNPMNIYDKHQVMKLLKGDSNA